MLSDFLKCTSINHCSNGMNHQIDYTGTQLSCINDFEQWCIKHNVKWAHLFDQKDGDRVASYIKPATGGLIVWR